MMRFSSGPARALSFGAVLAALLLCLAPAPAGAVDPEYQTLMRNARRFLSSGQAEPAARIFQQVLRRHPTDLDASVGYADALVAQQKFEEADAFLTEALTKVEGKAGLGRARVRLRRAQDRLPEAFSDVLLVLEESPDLGAWAARETWEILDAGLDPKKAARDVEEAILGNAQNAELLVLRGLLDVHRGKPEEGLAFVAKGDEARKQEGQILFRYAQGMEGLGKEAEALAAMRAAAERTDKPTLRSEILFRAADLQERAGDYPAAVASLDRIAAERAGTTAAGRALLGSARIYQEHLHDPQGALSVYLRLDTDPELGHHRPDMLLQMGDCFLRLDRLKEAGQVFARVPAEAFDPEDAEEAAFMLAEVVFFQGRADSAMALYQSMAENYVRSLRADDAAARYVILNKYQALGGGEAVRILGRMEWARWVGRSDLADSTAHELIELYPGGELAAAALLTLAESAQARGDLDGALRHLDVIVADMPQEHRRAEALLRQGAILERLGRPQDAVEKYETLITDHSGSVLVGEARRQVERLRREIKS